FSEATSLYGELMDIKPEGYAVDKKYPDIIYVPEDTQFDLHKQKVLWDGGEIGLQPDKTYVRPSGYKVRSENPRGPDRLWLLVGIAPTGTLCHKPCTVSGGGKSEISKPITDAILTGPVFVADFKKDFDRVAELINWNYKERFIHKLYSESR